MFAYLKYLIKKLFGKVQVKYYPCVREWTTYGESTAAMLGQVWQNWFGKNTLANYAVGGSLVEFWLMNPDPIKRKNIILFIGGNNILNAGMSVQNTYILYMRYLQTIKADRIYCVGLSPVNRGEEMLRKAQEFNALVSEGIRNLKKDRQVCFIPVWDLFDVRDSLTDGVHHTTAYDLRIIKRILDTP